LQELKIQLDHKVTAEHRDRATLRAKANDHRIVHTCVDEAVSGALEADG